MVKCILQYSIFGIVFILKFFDVEYVCVASNLDLV